MFLWLLLTVEHSPLEPFVDLTKQEQHAAGEGDHHRESVELGCLQLAVPDPAFLSVHLQDFLTTCGELGKVEDGDESLGAEGLLATCVGGDEQVERHHEGHEEAGEVEEESVGDPQVQLGTEESQE